jgi:urease accessory protein
VLASRGELPLIIQRPIRGPRGEAVVALLTPAGALFAGDALDLDVECEPGTDVTLTTAGATRLNRCDDEGIEVHLQVRVAGGAVFRYLPHEVIPFAGTRYQQRIEVEVAPGGGLALLEILSPGSSHARFSYASLGFWTTVTLAGLLMARERFLLTPRTARQFAEWTHYGSLLTVGMAPGEPLQCESSIQVGVSALPGADGRVLKALGHSAHAVRAALLGRLSDIDWLDVLLPA